MREFTKFSDSLLSSSSPCRRNSSYLRNWTRSRTVCRNLVHSKGARLKSCRNRLYLADTRHQFCCISDGSSILCYASISRYPTRAFNSVIFRSCKDSRVWLEFSEWHSSSTGSGMVLGRTGDPGGGRRVRIN
jgi:hypothetical protein